MKNKSLLLLLALLPVSFIAQKKITIMPSIGYAWRVAELPDNLPQNSRDFLKQLKTGMTYDLAAYYPVNSTLGLGAKFNLYTASANGSITMTTENQYVYSLETVAKDQILFVGPSLLYSNFGEETPHKLFYELALGLISYKSRLGGAEITGSNVGLSGDIGYMYAINPSFMIGPKLNFTAGTLSNLKVGNKRTNLGENEKEGLARVGLNLGAAFRF